jgi:transcriptional regulator with XRE-family HTH domain
VPETLGYGQMIRDARDRKGISQRELGEAVRVSESTISNFEREQHAPGIPDQFNDLVVALNLSPVRFAEALGMRMTPVGADKLPRLLVSSLVGLSPQTLDYLTPLVEQLAAAGPLQLGRHR